MGEEELVTLVSADICVGKWRILRNVNLVINRGDYICITGRSGSGKTTLLRVVAGILPPCSGRRISALDHGKYRDIGYVPQYPVTLEHLTVLENVAFALCLRGISWGEAVKRARKSLELLGIEDLENRLAGELSGGEKKLLSHAIAIAPKPTLLVVDEPLSGLDTERAAHVIGILSGYAGRGAVVHASPTIGRETPCTTLYEAVDGRLIKVS